LSVADLLALEPEAGERLQRLWLGYTEYPGSPSLRREISRLYRTIEPDQVLVHAGAEEAIFLFMHAMLEAGDHVVVQSPCYQSLASVARRLGCEVTPWRGQDAGGWAPDPDELPRLLRPSTRAIVVNSPHNPTGFHFSPQAFAQISDLAQSRGLLLFSDEVYRESEYQLADRLPAACDLGEHAVSLGVMSKTYGLAGLRIGWVATRSAAVRSRMAALKDYTTICNSAPSELLAEVALRHRDVLVQRNLSLILANLRLLDELFARHADRFAWHRPAAGPIAFPRLQEGDVAAFCRGLVESKSVLLLPGTVYGEERHFRVGFGRRNLPGAIARLEEYLSAPRSL